MPWHSQEPLFSLFGILIATYSFYNMPAPPQMLQEEVTGKEPWCCQ